MKTKSGIYGMTKAAIVLLLVMTIQTGFGQVFGIYSKKKSLRKKYKCENIGVQKVKHLQGRSKTIKTISRITPSNEILLASISKNENEKIIPIIEQERNTEENLSEKETKKDTSIEKLRPLPIPVYFRYDSYRLDIIDLTQIALAVTYVKEGYSVQLVGHTDNWGSEKYNEILSLKRANIIRDMMIELGCKPELIAAKGEGEKYPADTNEHHEGRQSNRRVEFLIALNAD
jgi:outer membrane protein OmpA-like peptidoglycan-associated protein